MIHKYSSLFLALCLATITAFAKNPKPNIIFVLTDDLGYGDIGILYQNSRDNGSGSGQAKDGIQNGTEKPFMKTPTLDRMAREGAILSQHYTSAPVCAPARASFLQGRDQGHSNIRNNSFDAALENNHTLGTVMKSIGYKTAIIGKWGLQGGGGKDGQKAPRTVGDPQISPAYPTKRGFDYFFGYLDHMSGHYHYPKEGRLHGHRSKSTVWDQDVDITDKCDLSYSTDLFTARAKKWIRDHKESKEQTPFFLYLAYTAPHAALEVPTQKYPKGLGLNGGLKWTGKAGQIINTASGQKDSWIHDDYKNQKWPASAKRHATMVRRIDTAMSDIMQTLKDLKIDKETLIVFTSDNGPHHEGSWRGINQNPQFFSSYANMDGTKRDLWEAGIRVPTIAWWPSKIGDNKNSTPAKTIDFPSAFWDWMPTFTQVAGKASPAWSNGVSLLPSLTERGRQKDKNYLYFEYAVNSSTPGYKDFHKTHRGQKRGQMQAIILKDPKSKQRFKGIRYDIKNAQKDFKIYRVDQDPGETQNLAKDYPQLQKQMKDKVLQVRKNDPNYTRPYSQAFIPALKLNQQELRTGLDYKIFKGNWPYLPDTSYLKARQKGQCSKIEIPNSSINQNYVMELKGYIKVEKDASYTFYLTADKNIKDKSSAAGLWLHDIHLIDNDFHHDGSTIKATIKLKAGLHPLRLLYKHTKGQSDLKLELKMEGASRQELALKTLFRDKELKK